MEDRKEDKETPIKTEIPIIPIPPKKKYGRPKGRKDGVLGLSLNKRLKELKKIIGNPAIKEADRIMAVRLMSELMGDRIKTAGEDNQQIVMIKFEEIDKDYGKKGLVAVEGDNNGLLDDDKNVLKSSEEVNDEQSSHVLEVLDNKGVIEDKGNKVGQNVPPVSYKQEIAQKPNKNAINGHLDDSDDPFTVIA